MGWICLFSLLLFAIFCLPALANDASILNASSGGLGYGIGYSVQQTIDDGYIIAGTNYSNQPKLQSQMVVLIKTDSYGNEVWDKMFGGPRNDIGYSIQQTDD
ncbi:MAG TPA: hypothetical protein VF300_05290, partial [Methanothrix sp.]